MKFQPGEMAVITTGDGRMVEIEGRITPILANTPVIIIGQSEDFNGWFRVYFPIYSDYGHWPRSGLAKLQKKGEA